MQVARALSVPPQPSPSFWGFCCWKVPYPHIRSCLRPFAPPHPPLLAPPLPLPHSRPILPALSNPPASLLRTHLSHSAAPFPMQRKSWDHCADAGAAAAAAAATLAMFDDARATGHADGVDQEFGPQIIKILLDSSSAVGSNGNSEHIIDRLCSRIASASAAVTTAYNAVGIKPSPHCRCSTRACLFMQNPGNVEINDFDVNFMRMHSRSLLSLCLLRA